MTNWNNLSRDALHPLRRTRNEEDIPAVFDTALLRKLSRPGPPLAKLSHQDAIRIFARHLLRRHCFTVKIATCLTATHPVQAPPLPTGISRPRKQATIVDGAMTSASPQAYQGSRREGRFPLSMTGGRSLPVLPMALTFTSEERPDGT